MKIKKIILSMIAVALTVNFSPKSHANVDSADYLETTVRQGGFVRVFAPLVMEGCKLRLLSEINNMACAWKGKDVFEVKDILRKLANCPRYIDAIDVELCYIATCSDTVDEILENLKNMQEAYQRVINHFDICSINY